MYRRLAVLLPQAPIPLVTVLQLWGITDPREAQETVQIFVMQVGLTGLLVDCCVCQQQPGGLQMVQVARAPLAQA